MNLKESLKISLGNAYKGLMASFSEEKLGESLISNTTKEGTKIEYSVLETGTEIFSIPTDEKKEAELLKSSEITLSDDTKVATDENGKIVEIKLKEEAPVVVELTYEQKNTLAVALSFNLESLKELVDTSKNGWHCVDFSIQDGAIAWADISSNTYQALLSEQTEVKTALAAEKTKVVDLEAKIVTLQTLNTQVDPTVAKVELKNEKPLSDYEIGIGIRN